MLAVLTAHQGGCQAGSGTANFNKAYRSQEHEKENRFDVGVLWPQLSSAAKVLEYVFRDTAGISRSILSWR